MPQQNTSLPLSGVKVLELMGIGPTPYAGQILADFGAKVIRIEKKNGIHLPIENRKKTIVDLDLTKPDDLGRVKTWIADTDILIEGARPGVAEKLGLGPKDCFQINPRLVYGRMTGWGQTGPWAQKAGHDINYIGLTGALLAMGNGNLPPTPPLNLVGDYGGGSMFLVAGILAALLQAQKSGHGRVIDTAIVDGTASMMGIVYSLEALGMWTPKRQSNLLDGGRPFYRCYETQDGGFMAVGCIEEKFYQEMLTRLGIDIQDFGGQNDPKLWPQQTKRLTSIFASRPRQYWEEVFENSDACVTPVLSYEEAPNHPHNKARNSHHKEANLIIPSQAPRFL